MSRNCTFNRKLYNVQSSSVLWIEQQGYSCVVRLSIHSIALGEAEWILAIGSWLGLLVTVALTSCSVFDTSFVHQISA